MKAYIRISKKHATREEIDKLKKILDDAGLVYYMDEEVEK